MDLPKRFHENAKVQHRYSKRDAEEQKRRNPVRLSESRNESSSKKHPRIAFVGPLVRFPMGHFLQSTAALSRCRLPFAVPRAGYALQLHASGGGLGFGPGGKESKKGSKGKAKSGLSQFKESNPGAVPEVEMVFTCNKCETRQSKRFTRLAYEKGVVIVKCDGCGVQHLIADNQGYFKDWTGTDSTNVEKLLAEKGEKVDNRLGKFVERDDGTLELRHDAPDRSA
mmetsp:Transcript_26476/g.53099  ORF Transcript_26476/g.53099 Transcript_26476/m.53099 type:complete len:225 (-) Transcript_26476:116-790(-)